MLSKAYFFKVNQTLSKFSMTPFINRNILLSFSVFLFYLNASGQAPKNAMLFVLDSIPIITDPEEWNPILPENIADSRVVSDKDTLRLLGYKNLEGVTYIFTKEYRNRPDSLKLIPSLKRMEMLDNIWSLHKIPYSGKYIDYFNSGKKQDEGTLFNGKLSGELVVYFKNGNKKSVSNFKNGILDGMWSEYYTNAAVRQTREFSLGNEKGTGKIYFITGQIQSEVKSKRDSKYDTAFIYYSTGIIREITILKNHEAVFSKKKNEINYYTTIFNQSINNGDLKEANKSFFKIWKLDSSGIDTYFLGGILRLKELHFDKAIAEFDKALMIEPMMRESLVHRALARIKKNQFLHEKKLSKNTSEEWTSKDILLIPTAEQNKICIDIQQSEYLDFSESYVKKIIPEIFYNYCRTSSSQ